ncbi:hypothetical protein Tco_1067618 [Tanacetum coccineum]|uniref:Uncharacterized protein n=1 Tax=Tanacetum coccineum TaxID=301880 RepID=A0ABQ5HEQ7_9ASTR
MACSLPHTDSKIGALVQRLINEDKGCQDALLELAFGLKIHALSETTLEKPMRSAMTFLKRAANCYLTEKELHQLRMDEEALRETLEEEAINKKAQEEKIRQKQAEDDKFFLEFGIVRYDSEYESSD